MKHVSMKTNGGGGLAPRILILVTRLKWMVITGYQAGKKKEKISTPAENWTAVVNTVASHCTELRNRTLPTSVKRSS